MEMSEAGKLSPTSINDYAWLHNAFLKWMKDEGHLTDRHQHPENQSAGEVAILLSDQQVMALIQYKPKNRIERRIHMMVLVVLDTGVRVDEVSHIRRQDVDMGNLLLTVHKGKGGKQRVVPFSLVLRRALFRFMKTEPHPQSEFVFSTRSGLPQRSGNLHVPAAHHGGSRRADSVREGRDDLKTLADRSSTVAKP